MKSAVLHNAIWQQNRRRQSAEWLQDAIKFDHSLSLINRDLDAIQKIFQLTEVSNRKENRRNFDVLLANLLNVKKRKPVQVSLSPNEWKRTRYTTAGASTIQIIQKLNELGYMEMKIGYHTENESRETRIWPTKKLLQYFPKLDQSVIKKPVELVELRDEKGNLKTYKDTKKTWQIRSILQKVNKLNREADIRYQNEKLNASLVAVFNKNFSLYGRLHTRGYRHYQGRSEDERKEITINGDSIIELDYSGLHPYLLYAKEGQQFFGDPYSVVDKRSEARPFLKQILLCMLNAPDQLKAEKAANYWLYRNHKDREALKEIGITKARPVMETFREIHKPISHFFCDGKETGLRIMNLDARIALDIVNHFAKRNLPILAVHDSFLVQHQYQKELKRVMQEMYSKHTNGFRIKIK